MNDVLIIGGGVIGLAIALELQLQGVTVTVLSRNFSAAASHAAAGMLAPQAERLSPGPMLDLCLQSRSLYPDWTRKLEVLTGLETGYWSCGILAPVYEEDEGQWARGWRLEDTQQSTICNLQSTIPSPPHSVRLSAHDEASLLTPHPSAQWLDRDAIHQHQPGLSSEVTGGWWYPEDGQVDNRVLMKALRSAVQELGVQIQEGVTVETILHRDQQVTGVQTSAGTMQAGHYVMATGAWSQELLPIPVYPKKGQMLSLQVESGQEHPLQTVLFGSNVYIVPRSHGQIIIGATSEEVGFTPGNTFTKLHTLLTAAIRLYPELQSIPVHETWWGFRPATPDELPILGSSPFKNLTLATGHYRNGILLAPITARLIASVVLGQSNVLLLENFHWSRFTPEPILRNC